ncbi:hypothetical protein OMP43_08915 [Sphingomonas sp. CBMAI 2297]|uniref:hypothetical protein n=1 Tax=Sphingomonas sp. CBMAI 2297 TaxID=2991720 RepID=UPI002454959D|nr:hypothetical protein [Sphingomonas sp. CBMAI 2297]MDH4744135.1 hypothetical protein [Sphingomonas sp. CBMAI 2297]
MSPAGTRRANWVLFAAAVTGALAAAFILFGFLALGECLPRDGGAAMQACDAAKQREFWLYPALVIVSLAAAARLHAARPARGLALAVASPLLGMILLVSIERLVGG